MRSRKRKIILGLRGELNRSPSSSSEPSENDKQLPFIAGIFILGGGGFLLIAAFPFLKDRFKRYNKGDEEIPVDSEGQANN